MIIEGKRFIQGTVAAQRQWNRRLFSLTVNVDSPRFEAGQYTKLALPCGDGMVTRPYSFVNAPIGQPCEFYYVLVPGGQLTERLAQLKGGDSVWLLQHPMGFLVLSEVPEAQNLWLLATGTGIAPFLSILRSAASWQRYQKIVLVEAVRHAEELAYRDEIASLEQAHPERFHSLVFVSREDAPGAMSGRIPEAISSGRLEAAAGVVLSAQSSQVMICGNPAMVTDSVQALSHRGMTIRRRRGAGQITVENFW